MGMRFGVVGTGYWARETPASALSPHPDAELVGVWGRSFARATELAEAFGARAYEDVDDMFADVDAVALRCHLMDPVCPPSTVYAAYNHYGSQAGGVAKSIEVYEFNEHEGGGGHQFKHQLPWLAALAEGTPTATHTDGDGGTR